MTKCCSQCLVEKPLTDFYGGGYLGKCKECHKKNVRDNYAKRRDKYSEYDRKRGEDPKRKANKIEAMRKHRADNPEKYKARNALNNAIRDKKIIRQSCEVCGSAKSQAHHDDYSKPLEVRWLCFRHHRELEHGQTVTAA